MMRSHWLPTAVAPLFLAVWLWSGCGSGAASSSASPDATAADATAADTSPSDAQLGADGTAGDVAAGDVAPTDAAAAQDGDAQAADSGGEDGAAVDSTVEDSSGDVDAADQTVSDVVPPQDAVQPGDSAQPEDAEPTEDTSSCPYKCLIKCVCKKDKQGCDIPECESGECMTLLSQIGQLKPGLQQCKPEVGCQSFEFPICGSAGCFQLPIAADANTDALAKLASQAMDAQCSQFSCGCMPSKPSFCLGGLCRQCPPDCNGSCEDQDIAIKQAVDALSGCANDGDCTVLQTGLCPFAGFPCGGMALNKFAQTDQLQALLAAYAVPCNVAMCKCAAPGPAVCAAGKCAIKP